MNAEKGENLLIITLISQCSWFWGLGWSWRNRNQVTQTLRQGVIPQPHARPRSSPQLRRTKRKQAKKSGESCEKVTMRHHASRCQLLHRSSLGWLSRPCYPLFLCLTHRKQWGHTHHDTVTSSAAGEGGVSARPGDIVFSSNILWRFWFSLMVLIDRHNLFHSILYFVLSMARTAGWFWNDLEFGRGQFWLVPGLLSSLLIFLLRFWFSLMILID